MVVVVPVVLAVAVVAEVVEVVVVEALVLLLVRATFLGLATCNRYLAAKSGLANSVSDQLPIAPGYKAKM